MKIEFQKLIVLIPKHETVFQEKLNQLIVIMLIVEIDYFPNQNNLPSFKERVYLQTKAEQ